MTENEFERFDRMEAYYEGRLAENERTEFQVQLLVDLELQQEYEAYCRMRKGFKRISAESIRSRLSLIDRELDEKNIRSPRIRLRLWLAVAAMFILIAGVAWNYRYMFSPGPRIILPEEPGLPVTMSGAANGKTFHDAMSAFKMHEFEKAAREFQSLLVKNEFNDTLLFYRGCSLLQLDRFKEAYTCFDRISPQESSFGKKAGFYLAVSEYGKNLDEKSFRHEMEIIAADTGHPMHDAALGQLQR